MTGTTEKLTLYRFHCLECDTDAKADIEEVLDVGRPLCPDCDAGMDREVVRAVDNHARLVTALSNLIDIADPSEIGVDPDHDEAYYDAVAALKAVSP